MILTLALVLPLASALAQYPQPPPQINVSGSAEVKVVPDEVNIRVGVELRDANLDEARRQHDEHMKTALAFLKSSGVPDKQVQTDFISVEPQYSGDLSRTKPLVYIVRKSIEVKLTSVTNLDAILTGLLNNGVTHIHNVDFRTTQLRQYRDQARAMAIKAAKEKADALCKELDVKRGKPLNINANEYGGWWSSSSSYWGQSYNYNMTQNAVQNVGGSSDSAGDTLSLGQISVSATVNVSFAIQ